MTEEQAYLLGTRLIARSGLRTLTVRTADRLTFCRSSEYSNILESKQNEMIIENGLSLTKIIAVG